MLLQEEYVDSKLKTKYGIFNLRVYSDKFQKETFVLYAENLDVSKPVLVRIHSECITGDMLGSLQCDCGCQLRKSLKMIKEEGGAVVYLRQEGRGIGLFEKMKAYKLQAEGYDTFEANVLLGHLPDARTYDSAKKVLDDLNIKEVRLLTNNPSKVSDLARLGINVVERVPIVIESNKHNEGYLKTKRKKFQHFSETKAKEYLYQFQAESPEQIKEIAQFLSKIKKDPLLKIGVGISANHKTLSCKEEIQRIESFYIACNELDSFVPVLHFTFKDCEDPLKEVQKIKESMPFVKQLQLNDLPSIGLTFFKETAKLFSLHVPLDDENFEAVENEEFRTLIKQDKMYLHLDNSKGQGIEEPIESLREKVETLLSYGINDIILSGGYGPDRLHSYFELRRYYKINFSIDAETRLRTRGKFDTEKIKLYLLQLIRFSNPKSESVKQTREFLKKHRRSDWESAYINGCDFLIHPEVFHAGYFPSSAWYANKMVEVTKDCDSFCEVGCGCGVISCQVAQKNSKIQVIATDLNPHASENTKINAKRLNLMSQVSVYNGDVLDGIKNDIKFDVIFWALPFGFLDPGIKLNNEEMQVFDPGYRAVRKFFISSKNYLKPSGKIYFAFSKDLGHLSLLKEIADECKLKLNFIEQKKLKETDEVSFELYSGQF